ncbi:hypothetical protein ACIQD2_11765 [Dietzia maris]
MFCYQAAAYRRSRDLESIVTFGTPIDWRGNAPLGIPEQVVVTIARFVADCVFSDRPLPGWLASTAFRLLDPIMTARSQVDILRQLHDRDALLGHERQRRFAGGEGFVAWSGPALVDMLQQVIVQNRMMVGGFVVGDRVVSLADITCPSSPYSARSTRSASRPACARSRPSLLRPRCSSSRSAPGTSDSPWVQPPRR